MKPIRPSHRLVAMRYVICTVIVAAVVGLFGCNDLRLKGEGIADPGSVREPWPFVPVAMRVHPFTSISRDEETGGIVLDARIELLDQLGDVTKGVGTCQFELFEVDQRASTASNARASVASWQASIMRLDENRRHYDPITRTYVFKLKVDASQRPRKPLLFVACFTDHLGRRLNAESPLNVPAALRDATK